MTRSALASSLADIRRGDRPVAHTSRRGRDSLGPAAVRPQILHARTFSADNRWGETMAPTARWNSWIGWDLLDREAIRHPRFPEAPDQAPFVDRVATQQMVAQDARRPDAELRAALRVHPVADGGDHVQFVEVLLA